MRSLKLRLTTIGTALLTSVFGAGQEMVYQSSFPTEAMLAQDVYLKYGSGLACDRAGNVWVVDSGSGVILQFDPAGLFLKKAGRPGQEPGEFSRPATISASSTKTKAPSPGSGRGSGRIAAVSWPLSRPGGSSCRIAI